MRTAPLFSPLLLAAALTAQTPANLIAVTLNTPVIHQGDHGTCTGLGTCLPTGLPPTTTFYWAGGAAWDPATNSLWATTGQALGRYQMNGCTTTCPVGICPKSSPVAEATGLDLHDALNQLWVIDSAGWITWCTNACPPVVIGSCNTGLALSGFTATTGIAIDELRGLVFYSTADFNTGSGWIYAAPLANPCAWFQVTPVQDCFSNPNLVTGIACDAGRGVLYWTNGRGTFDWAYTYNPAGPSVAWTPGTCCIQLAPFFDPYTDLAIRWGGAVSSGAPCANGSCPACPMSHVLRNAPLLGTNLQLGLDFAALGMPYWCVLSFGACGGGGGGSTFPPLCAFPLVPLNAATFSLGVNFTAPGSGCTGTTTFVLPLPGNPALAGVPMASQCIGLCPPIGTTMSNCLSFVLQ